MAEVMQVLALGLEHGAWLRRQGEGVLPNWLQGLPDLRVPICNMGSTIPGVVMRIKLDNVWDANMENE